MLVLCSVQETWVIRLAQISNAWIGLFGYCVEGLATGSWKKEVAAQWSSPEYKAGDGLYQELRLYSDLSKNVILGERLCIENKQF